MAYVLRLLPVLSGCILLVLGQGLSDADVSTSCSSEVQDEVKSSAMLQVRSSASHQGDGSSADGGENTWIDSGDADSDIEEGSKILKSESISDANTHLDTNADAMAGMNAVTDEQPAADTTQITSTDIGKEDEQSESSLASTLNRTGADIVKFADETLSSNISAGSSKKKNSVASDKSGDATAATISAHIQMALTQPLTEEGFKNISKSCSDKAMRVFIKRVAKDMGLKVCDEGALNGMTPFYVCPKNPRALDDLIMELLSATPVTTLKTVRQELNESMGQWKTHHWLVRTEDVCPHEGSAPQKKISPQHHTSHAEEDQTTAVSSGSDAQDTEA